MLSDVYTLSDGIYKSFVVKDQGSEWHIYCPTCRDGMWRIRKDRVTINAELCLLNHAALCSGLRQTPRVAARVGRVD
jgi:hypothetical protein